MIPSLNRFIVRMISLRAIKFKYEERISNYLLCPKKASLANAHPTVLSRSSAVYGQFHPVHSIHVRFYTTVIVLTQTPIKASGRLQKLASAKKGKRIWVGIFRWNVKRFSRFGLSGIFDGFLKNACEFSSFMKGKFNCETLDKGVKALSGVCFNYH